MTSISTRSSDGKSKASVMSDETSSIPGASLNLLNSIVGAGIVAIPHAIQQCGLCLGVFLLVFLAFGIYKIITILMECGLRAGKLNLEELSGHFFGSSGYNLAAIIMFLYSFGSMVACVVVIGDTLPPSLHELFGLKLVNSRDEVVLVVGACIVLPLSLVRHMSSLAFASGLAFFAVVVLVLGVLLVGPEEAHSQGLSFDMDEDFTIVNKDVFRGIGVLSFHYVCQHSCLLIFKSLETHSMENVREVARISLGVVFVFSVMIGLGGYIFFTNTTDGNILNNFHAQSDVIAIARLCMAINMIFTFPMECFVVRHALWALLTKYFPSRHNGRPSYDLALAVSDHGSVGSSNDSSRLGSISFNTVNLNSSRDEYSEDGIRLVQWSSVPASPNRSRTSSSSVIHDANELSPSTLIHVLLTVFLWATSLSIALGFDDVSVVVALSGIVAASILGYILPVAIYLKTHEDKVKRKLASVGLYKNDKGGNLGSDLNTQEQSDFNRNMSFFVILGVFGICSLLIGLIIEIRGMFGVGKEEDQTAMN